MGGEAEAEAEAEAGARSLPDPPREAPDSSTKVDTVQASSGDTGVFDKNTPFVRALTMQSSSKNSYPPPDLALGQCIFPRVFF